MGGVSQQAGAYVRQGHRDAIAVGAHPAQGSLKPSLLITAAGGDCGVWSCVEAFRAHHHHSPHPSRRLTLNKPKIPLLLSKVEK